MIHVALAFIILYYLSRIFIQKLFVVLYRVTHDRDDAVVILGWIFAPGTFIHEISHFLSALILMVPVGEMDLMPEAEDDGIKLGKVAIGKTDFIRGSLIGLAPVISGGAILFSAISFALPRLGNLWIAFALIYVIFQITHTMFSSKKDLFAVLELIVFLAVLSGFLIFFKIYTPFIYIYGEILKIEPIIGKHQYLFYVPVGMELVFLAFFRKIRI